MNYNTFGGNFTYKGGVRYTPIPDFTIRGTYSTGFRAPPVGDLYSGTGPSFPNVSDPCGTVAASNTALLAQCGTAANNGDDATQLAETVGGNPKLKPESAKIATAGLVIEPQMVKNLSFTADFWTVSLDQTLGAIGANVILSGCYPASTAAGGTPNPDYCKLITRNPVTHMVQNILEVGKLQEQKAVAAQDQQFGLAGLDDAKHDANAFLVLRRRVDFLGCGRGTETHHAFVAGAACARCLLGGCPP